MNTHPPAPVEIPKTNFPEPAEHDLFAPMAAARLAITDANLQDFADRFHALATAWCVAWTGFQVPQWDDDDRFYVRRIFQKLAAFEDASGPSGRMLDGYLGWYIARRLDQLVFEENGGRPSADFLSAQMVNHEVWRFLWRLRTGHEPDLETRMVCTLADALDDVPWLAEIQDASKTNSLATVLRSTTMVEER